jgi:formylglycine-generating enzyme required for sulfatase activity
MDDFPAGLVYYERTMNRSRQDEVLELAPEEAARIEWVSIPALDIRMSKTPISRSAYACFSPGYAPGDGPAVGVSWDDAARFCKWLTEQYGTKDKPSVIYRLPTEMEWESCVLSRVVSEPVWKESCPDFGSDADFASVEDLCRSPDGHYSFEATAWGLLQPKPSLWEWTGDIYDPTKNCRILRGACWHGWVDGKERTFYHRTPKPSRGRPDIVFRIVQDSL